MKTFEGVIQSNKSAFGKIIDFDGKADKLLAFDFTAANSELTDEMLVDTDLFSAWINQKLEDNGAKFGIGGYDEHRTIYSRSTHFGADEEPRRLHLGVDIWAPALTPVYNFYEAKVHSFANNNNFGDYGATIILSYQIDGYEFHALYGHLSLASLSGLEEGQIIPKGKAFATLGFKKENGFWPPHLHFQIIKDMEGYRGDYIGVCKFSEREKYLANCPNPNLILGTE